MNAADFFQRTDSVYARLEQLALLLDSGRLTDREVLDTLVELEDLEQEACRLQGC